MLTVMFMTRNNWPFWHSQVDTQWFSGSHNDLALCHHSLYNLLFLIKKQPKKKIRQDVPSGLSGSSSFVTCTPLQRKDKFPTLSSLSSLCCLTSNLGTLPRKAYCLCSLHFFKHVIKNRQEYFCFILSNGLRFNNFKIK